MSANKQWTKLHGRGLLAVLIFNALSPLSVLAQEPGTISPQAQIQLRRMAAMQAQVEQNRLENSRSPVERIDEDLKQAQDALDTLRSDAQARGTAARSTQGNAALLSTPRALSETRRAEQTQALRDRLNSARAGQDLVLAEFERTGQEIKGRHLSAEIQARHENAMQDFAARKAEFVRLHSDWLVDPSDAKIVALAEFFDRYPAKRKLAPRDPKKLPWSTPEPTMRTPATTKTAWNQNLWGDRRIVLAQAGGSIGGINFDIPPEPGTAPTESDLAETPETQRTAAIAAKAVELGNNALTIHNWVRNSVDFVPTWGAVQSAQDTLDKKRGNAHDIASLEIALLRAAKIPTRYRYGTIELPPEQVQNWVGGVNNPSSAQQLLAQGGIANVARVGGGKVQAIQLEHVWVDAYVNWSPSRGAKQGKADQHVNPVGPHNAWVSLDPSYKQYSYAPGMDLKTAVPLDGQALVDAAKQGATVNEAEGWVQNANQAAILSQFSGYQARLSAYVQSQSQAATVGDVIGKTIIEEIVASLLAATLPYTVAQTGEQTAAVPAALQHRFTYKLYASDYDRMLGSPFLTYSEKLSQLVGKRVTLNYLPASQADADTIASHLPKAHADGSPIQPNEYPASLPGYLIRLRPQIKLDGQVVATSDVAFVMGTSLLAEGGFTSLGQPGAWDLTSDDSNTVGNATTIGINAQGISAQQIRSLKARLEAAQAKLQVRDTTGLSGEQLTGDLLTATLWTWFASAEYNGHVTKNQAGMVEIEGLSYGLFHMVARPSYSWGMIRSVAIKSVSMDIGHMRTISWAKDNDSKKWVLHNQLRGQHMSGLEHAVPERFFNDPTTCNLDHAPSPVLGLPACPQGISAVKAIAFAAQTGQKIYTITRSVYAGNSNIVNLMLTGHSESTRTAVQGALDAGQEVMIHEQPIVLNGWIGSGYTTVDPETGAGGYIIDGGLSGGELESALTTLFGLLSVVVSVLPFALIGVYLLGPVIALAIIIILVWSLVLYEIQELPPGNARSIIANLAWGAFGIALGALTGAIWVALLAWVLGSIGNTYISLLENWRDDRQYV